MITNNQSDCMLHLSYINVPCHQLLLETTEVYKVRQELFSQWVFLKTFCNPLFFLAEELSKLFKSCVNSKFLIEQVSYWFFFSNISKWFHWALSLTLSIYYWGCQSPVMWFSSWFQTSWAGIFKKGRIMNGWIWRQSFSYFAEEILVSQIDWVGQNWWE